MVSWGSGIRVAPRYPFLNVFKGECSSNVGPIMFVHLFFVIYCASWKYYTHMSSVPMEGFQTVPTLFYDIDLLWSGFVPRPPDLWIKCLPSACHRGWDQMKTIPPPCQRKVVMSKFSTSYSIVTSTYERKFLSETYNRPSIKQLSM